MLNFLINKFIKNSTDTSSSKVRTSYGLFSSILSIICNVILFTAKIIIGIISGSIAVSADAVNNLSDAASNVISLFGFKLSCRPADDEHPYGHGRYEYLAGLIVAVLILVIGIELLKSSITKSISPTPLNFSPAFIPALIFSIAMKLWMMYFNKTIGKKINSETLLATAADSRNDVIATLSVLIAIVISHFTSLYLDGIIGVLVSLFILYSGFGIVKNTLDLLIGKAPDTELVNSIKEKILGYPGVLGTHDLLVHDYGPGRQFASVHIEMSAEVSSTDSHDVIDCIERDFLSETGIHMTVHLDPISSSDTDMLHWLNNKAKEINCLLSVHDLHIIQSGEHIKLTFDCLIPHESGCDTAETVKKLTSVIKNQYPAYECIINIDKNYTSVIN